MTAGRSHSRAAAADGARALTYLRWRAERWFRPHEVGGAVVGVSRRRNAALVGRLLRPALDAGWTTAWWALDEVAPELASHTVGVGPGEKLALLNAVSARVAPPQGWLVLSDDDIEFVRGNVVELVTLSASAGFCLSQPAHAVGSALSHAITASRAGSLARRTSFVESGPLVAVAPEWRDAVLPLPVDRGMGWGVELEWLRLQERGCVLGVVDAVPIRHLEPVGGAYDMTPYAARLREDVAAAGVSSVTDLQRTLGTWRPWQPRPRWPAP